MSHVQNPFYHRGPVRDPSFFFGRAGLVSELGDLLRQGQSVAISGPRRIGKTSLIAHLSHTAVAAGLGLGPETTAWAYLDGGQLDGLGEEWFYGAIGQALGSTDQATDYPQLIGRLQGLASAGRRLVVAIDEFELIAANPLLGLTLFNRLRGMAGALPIQFITASRDALLDLAFAHPSTLSSPFFNIFAPAQVGPLELSEASSLLTALSARGGAPFDAHDVGRIIDLTGPQPLFLQVAGYRLFAARAAGAAGAWERARAQALDDIEPHLTYAWATLDLSARRALALLPLRAEGSIPTFERLQRAGLIVGRSYLGEAVERFVRRQQIDDLLQRGALLIDLRRGVVASGSKQIHLTPTEYAALRLFMERPGEVITPEQIEAALWPGETLPDPERARGVVKKLRAALGPAGEAIANRRGQGYLLE